MTADSIRGVVGIEMALRRRAKGCVLGVTAARPFNPWIGKPEIAGTVEEIAEELAFSTWCPTGTSIQTLVTVEGRRWAIEDAFKTAKTELGLAHETRSCTGGTGMSGS